MLCEFFTYNTASFVLLYSLYVYSHVYKESYVLDNVISGLISGPIVSHYKYLSQFHQILTDFQNSFIGALSWNLQ